jgi:hypothetical protein
MAYKDQWEKLLLYCNMPSRKDYLIVAPDDRWIELHYRAEDTAWRHERVQLGEATNLPCLPVELAVDSVLADLPSAGN